MNGRQARCVALKVFFSLKPVLHLSRHFHAAIFWCQSFLFYWNDFNIYITAFLGGFATGILSRAEGFVSSFLSLSLSLSFKRTCASLRELPSSLPLTAWVGGSGGFTRGGVDRTSTQSFMNACSPTTTPLSFSPYSKAYRSASRAGSTRFWLPQEVLDSLSALENKSPKMVLDLFSETKSYTLFRQDGLTVGLREALANRQYVMLFIAGQWWSPCRGVARQLSSFYASHSETLGFEIIFLSADKSSDAMLNFFRNAQGDWLCFDYDDARQLEAELAADPLLHSPQLPALLVFEIIQSNGDPVVQPVKRMAQLTTRNGREMLSRDKDAKLFPWRGNGWRDTKSLRSPSLVQPDAWGRETEAERRISGLNIHRNTSKAQRGDTDASAVVLKSSTESNENEGVGVSAPIASANGATALAAFEVATAMVVESERSGEGNAQLSSD